MTLPFWTARHSGFDQQFQTFNYHVHTALIFGSSQNSMNSIAQLLVHELR